MKRFLPLPSYRELSERLDYDPLTGKFTWKTALPGHHRTERGRIRFNQKMAGREAGHRHLQPNGKRHAVVIRIHVNKKDMWLLAHRVAFVLMLVPIPRGFVVDHINGDPWDNRWVNLRAATDAQNAANSAGNPISRRYGALPKGVSPQKGRYKAQICHLGKKRHIGMFATPVEAKAAYDAEAKLLRGEFFRA